MMGVFDSGFGGLHVLKSITTRLPQYGYVYLGDSARAPYGPRSFGEVYAFTKQGVDFLFSRGAHLVVLACNTASSEALRKIQMEYSKQKSALGGLASDRKVLGVLIPFAEATASRTKNKRVGVLATEGTVRSGSYVREITKIDPAIQVFQQATPELVPFIEKGEQDSLQMGELLEGYVRPLLANDIDTLVLGCTHYGIIEKKIHDLVGNKVTVISDSDVVPPSLEKYLARHPEIESRIEKNGTRQFFTTGDTTMFEKLGSQFFGSPIKAERAELGT